MIKKSVQKQIDETIKEVWLKNIRKDFAEDYIINEDCLKIALCYHLRRKLARVLRENNLRIYTEKYFSGMKKKPDIIIAQIREDYPESNLYDSVREEDIVALLELKFKSDKSKSTSDWIRKDIRKLKEYVQESRMQCQMYFAVVYEVDRIWLHWLDGRSTNNWAAGRVTELDAGKIDETMKFEIHSY